MSVLAIIGPTASGKSDLAFHVADRLAASGWRVEVVAVDAFTVYRGMDVGTAKPTPSERRRVAHHMVDVLDPSEEVTVAWFQRHARRAIDAIRERGAVPLLVGGSGLYWRAVVDPLEFPPTDPDVRARVEQQVGDDPVAAHERLRGLDPEAAARIEPSNLRRVVRALEVLELTGRRFSSFRTAWEGHDGIYPDLRVVQLDPPGDRLRLAIESRVERMLDDGLIDETRALVRRGPLSRTAAQAIGYAEALAVIDGSLAHADLVESVSTRTWRYARRQRAWFRRDPRGPRIAAIGATREAIDHLCAPETS
ncbi:MAG: tRNA (adenosine(37)-N6)-dimethylallyltransferase MiaA [Nitriliruptoraceae bacterium]